MDTESLDRIFEPRSVAVVGASNVPGKWGFVVPMNIRMGRFTGRLYFVNRTEKRILGARAYPSISAIEDTVDLALIMIPAAGVPQAINECAEKKIPGVVVISSNFSEVGEDGARLEREVVGLAREAGITLIGPNTMGICCPSSSLYAMFAAVYPSPGHIAFLSQSGNLGLQILGWGYKEGVGFSRFVNSGNEAMVSSESLLEYFGEDRRTKVILMYMEGMKDGERFLRAAARISRTKPIIVLKAGGTEAGARAARSHSGSIAGDRRVFEAAAAQAGIILVRNTEELIETAKTFAYLPVPAGKRVGIMTLGGGWGVVTADACSREGLALPPLPRGMVEGFNSFLPAFWSHGNPVDMVGTPQRSHHFRVLEEMTRSPEFDALISLGSLLSLTGSTLDTVGFALTRIWRLVRGFSFSIVPFAFSFVRGIMRALRSQPSPQKGAPQPSQRSGGINIPELRQWDDTVYAGRVMELMKEAGKPILTVGFNPESTRWIFKNTGLVTFRSPERTAATLARLVRYSSYRERKTVWGEGGGRSAAVPDGVSRLISGRTGPLDEHEGKLLLREFGVPITAEDVASSPDHALAIAGRIGYPVVLKVVSPQVLHKTEAGGVAVGIAGPDDLRVAYDNILTTVRARVPQAEIKGVLVQEMVKGGTEVIIGMTRDPQFGPVILFGLGGIYVEVLKDVSLRVAPITEEGAREMVNEIKGAPVLRGFRGKPPADIDAVVRALVELSSAAVALKDRIAEIDVNPLIVGEKGRGAKAVDALVVLR